LPGSAVACRTCRDERRRSPKTRTGNLGPQARAPSSVRSGERPQALPPPAGSLRRLGKIASPRAHRGDAGVSLATLTASSSVTNAERAQNRPPRPPPGEGREHRPAGESLTGDRHRAPPRASPISKTRHQATAVRSEGDTKMCEHRPLYAPRCVQFSPCLPGTLRAEAHRRRRGLSAPGISTR
jgi:hypothetical protein